MSFVLLGRCESFTMRCFFKFFSFPTFFIGIFLPFFVSAETKDFSLSPLFHEVVLESGDTEKEVTVEISNRTGLDAEFFLSAVDFGTLDESGGVAFLGGSGDFERRYGLASWMRLPTERMILPAGATEAISIVIENKESLSPGGHYGAVAFQLENPFGERLSESLVAVRSSFASLFFVKKTGGEVARLEYADIQNIGRDRLGVPEKISLRFRNSGNIHLVPRGIVTVRDMRGRTVREGIINEDSGRILPESYRTYGVSLKKIASAFLPGRYTVSIEYRYDGSEEFVAAPARTVFPVLLTLLWTAGAILGLFFFVFLVKRFLKKK